MAALLPPFAPAHRVAGAAALAALHARMRAREVCAARGSHWTLYEHSLPPPPPPPLAQDSLIAARRCVEEQCALYRKDRVLVASHAESLSRLARDEWLAAAAWLQEASAGHARRAHAHTRTCARTPRVTLLRLAPAQQVRAPLESLLDGVESGDAAAMRATVEARVIVALARLARIAVSV